MLPVATPPNAIVFGSGLVTIPQMARAGCVLNLLFLILVAAASWWLVPWALGGG
jgi:sodium-dependent dicarboxylate transporter 2/3/5